MQLTALLEYIVLHAFIFHCALCIACTQLYSRFQYLKCIPRILAHVNDPKNNKVVDI